eukprot:TRINITY_DN2252_c0_g1_i1.p1 TRINITY_DN2252_c0_g1~~TRINITY_DN2252_c0_g1_i1.p1  ORF type:complete len:358 (+),score=113.17 TRINITY_DN2252_c0_g1_i1:62-1135(+)
MASFKFYLLCTVIAVIAILMSPLGTHTRYVPEHFEPLPGSTPFNYTHLESILDTGEYGYDHWITIRGSVLNHNVIPSAKYGKLLIFLHGFPESGIITWRHQLVHFAKLRRFHILAPDMRGFNTSSKGEQSDPITECNYQEMAEDLAVMITMLGYEQAHVVGHDWGAAAAWTFAMHYPAMVEKLVVINYPHPAVIDQFLFNTEQLRRSWHALFFQLDHIAEWRIHAQNFSWLIGLTIGTSNPGSYTEEEVARLRKSWEEPRAIGALLAWFRYLVRDHFPFVDHFQRLINRSPHAGRIKPPTLMLWGDKDAYFLREMARPSIDLCDDGSLVHFPHATHWLPNDDPKGVNSAIQNFFERR